MRSEPSPLNTIDAYNSKKSFFFFFFQNCFYFSQSFLKLEINVILLQFVLVISLLNIPLDNIAGGLLEPKIKLKS